MSVLRIRFRREFQLLLLLVCIVIFTRIYLQLVSERSTGESVMAGMSLRTFLPSGAVNPYKLNVLQNARAKDRQGRFMEAVKLYKKVLVEDDSDYRVNFELANVFMKLKRFEEATVYYQNVIELNPDFADTYSNLASARFSLGFVQEAIESLKKAVKLNPNFTVGYNNLAFIYLKSNRIDEAIKNYRKALELDSSLRSAQRGLNEALAAALENTK